MAESADILALPHQQVILPGPRRRLLDGRHGRARSARDLLGGARADGRRVARRAGDLHQLGGGDEVVRRRTRRHDLHLVERRGDADWAGTQKEKILFLPDQHLGRNTAWKMGVPLDDMVVWDPFEPFGGLTKEQLENARS